VDLWPYINGKAITLGLALGEMEASKMLDVIHFFFEEDARYTSPEEAQGVSDMRTRLYGSMYNVTYRYKMNSTGGSGNGYADGEVKPYIPPTEMDADSGLPFGSALEAPIG
jgi:hypothetical protein